ncbi:MAG TPA: NADPH-dependent FMN reductase [Xanthobacteraceae bacterium]|nr:NADPH-dependent FMN reductase [Xanthobacteraceae bacterium]
MTNPALAIVVGSNRRDSINRKLAQGIAKLAEARFDVKFVQIDDLPVYNQDHESDPPAPVTRLKNEIKAADALLFVTPEHNRSIPTVLKNAIDWGSRPYGQSAWGGKTAFVTGTTPGAIGTAMAQETLRTMLNFLGVVTLPAEAYITFKPGLIDEAGRIADESTRKFLQGFVDRLATLTAQTAPDKQRSAA